MHLLAAERPNALVVHIPASPELDTTVSTNVPATSRKLRVDALSVTHLDLAEEWHPLKNGALSPDDVSRCLRRNGSGSPGD